ncbi:MAG: hypothetical protein KAR40_15565 [Candidatus Sabulitectum sp.]|nr:hypothetical protein [Candidatus Sabulitectum sp.]
MEIVLSPLPLRARDSNQTTLRGQKQSGVLHITADKHIFPDSFQGSIVAMSGTYH